LLIREAAACPRPGLDDDLVAIRRERVHAGRDHADPVLVILDLLRNSDAHQSVPRPSGGLGGALFAPSIRWGGLTAGEPAGAAPDSVFISTRPLKNAPSAIVTRGAEMSPSSWPVAATSTRSAPRTSPFTLPARRTTRAATVPSIRPSAPIASVASMSTSPISSPSIERSVAPVIRPWIRVPGAMRVTARLPAAGSGEGCAAPEGGGAAGSRRKSVLREGFGAGNGIRTRDIKLGKLALYQLSYARSFSDLERRKM